MTFLAVGSLALTAGLVASAPQAGATPQLTLAQVQARVHGLEQKADQATETYDALQEQLASLQVRVGASKSRLAQEQIQIDRTRKSLGRLAAEVYRDGALSGLDLVLSDDPDAALARDGLTSSVGQREADLIQRLKAAKAQLQQDTAQVAAHQAQLAKAEAQIQQTRKQIVSMIAQAKAELSRLRASQRAELERVSRAKERAAIAAAKKAAAASDSSSSGSSSGDSGSSVGTSCQDVSIKAPNSRAAAAIAFACDQIGDSYVWGADGPSSWDCSGLTMKAWAKGGVSLPHSSRSQADYGTRVSRSELEPGDLVFFYSPISHVGIYIGDGLMIHAPNPSEKVKIAPLYDSMTAAVHL